VFVLFRRRITQRRSRKRRGLVHLQVHQLDQPKVRYLDHLLSRLRHEQNIRRLQIPMHDAMGVNRFQSPYHLTKDPPHSPHRKPLARRTVNHIRQRDAIDILQHRKRKIQHPRARPFANMKTRDAMIVESNHVRTGRGLHPHHTQHFCFPLKPSQRLRIDAIGSKKLDHDPHAIRLIVIRFVYPALPPLAEQITQIIPDTSASCQETTHDLITESFELSFLGKHDPPMLIHQGPRSKMLVRNLAPLSRRQSPTMKFHFIFK